MDADADLECIYKIKPKPYALFAAINHVLVLKKSCINEVQFLIEIFTCSINDIIQH